MKDFINSYGQFFFMCPGIIEVLRLIFFLRFGHETPQYYLHKNGLELSYDQIRSVLSNFYADED